MPPSTIISNEEFSAVEASEENGLVPPESRVYRFLLHGRLDLPVGDLSDLPSTSGETVTTLKEIFSESGMRKKVIDFIRRLYARGENVLSPLPKTVPFLLALISKCCDDNDAEVKETLNLALGLFAKLPGEFSLFVRFYLQLPSPPKSENVTLLIGSWYVKHDWRTLATLVGEGPANGGWSHRYIISYDGLIRFDDPCRQAVVAWARHGVIPVTDEKDRTSELAGVLEYFHNLDNLKGTTNPAAALVQIKHWLHGVRNVHPSLTRDKNVLTALVKRMDVRQLTNSIDQMSSLQLFRNESDSDWDMSFVRLVSYRLKSPVGIVRASLHPSESFIAMHSYLYKWKVMNESCLDEDERIWMPEPLISDDISSAFQTQMELAYKNVLKMDSDITVVIDPHLLRERYCEDAEFVRADKAAAFIALTLQRTGRNVKTFTMNGSAPVEVIGESVESISAALSSGSTTGSYSDFVHESSSDLVVLVGYALRTSEYFDKFDGKRNTPKLVLCNLSQVRVESPKDRGDILVTAGFNRNTCDVITAFAVFNLHTPIQEDCSKIAYTRRLQEHELTKNE